MTDLHEENHRTLRINKKLAGIEVNLRLNVIALAKKAGVSGHQDEAMKFSQAALNLANAAATLSRVDQGDN